ncbi:MAG: hypothetical protein A2Z21_03885 [Candidatus Fraserbacteria bacterium RBG_16_55_9]|uniref:Uncharacterized protein n=1 Tax=Fraserbacteria sp. (strain RBG_16_55_9) TaxID=1817864 RepID=A0A1F5UXA0_FRAXR|nr:MAG: hypothetical protein A2Z21_03885 [Candidatus Fraserbacteria bacterium RBG_16_55_9]
MRQFVLAGTMLLCLGFSLPAQDTDQEVLPTFSVFVKETVLVLVRGENFRRVPVEEPLFGLERFLNLGRFTIEVATVTDYELRLAGRFEHIGPENRQEIFIDPLPLEVRLDEAGMTGSPVDVSSETTNFVTVRRLPDSNWLFRGNNNVKDPTFAPIETRIDMRRLPPETVGTGSRIEFTLILTAIER